MGGGKTTTTSETKVDPKLMNLYYQNYNAADNLANTPYQPYTGNRVAGFNDTQARVKEMALGMANNQTGKSTLDQAISGMGGILNYTPGQVSAPTVTAGMLKDVNIADYLNPYVQNVVDTTAADLQRARDIERVRDNQRQTTESAFGGARHGVADSLTNAEYLRTLGSTTGALRSSGYDKAMGWAGDDINRKLTADSFNAGNAFDASKFNVNSDMAAAGLRANAANSLAGMSDQELAQEIRRMGALGMIGDAEQANTQAGLDAQYDEFMQGKNWPLLMQQLRSGALTQMPLQQTTTNTSKQSGGLGGILSAGLGIASMASGLGWAPFAAGAAGGILGGGGGGFNAFNDPFFGT